MMEGKTKLGERKKQGTKDGKETWAQRTEKKQDTKKE